jgi:hypothetical protein
MFNCKTTLLQYMSHALTEYVFWTFPL